MRQAQDVETWAVERRLVCVRYTVIFALHYLVFEAMFGLRRKIGNDVIFEAAAS